MRKFLYLLLAGMYACGQKPDKPSAPEAAFAVPKFTLIQTDTFRFNNFVDCNMAAAWIGDTVGGLVLAYGVVAGLGVGFAYVTPIAMCIKWFPDRRGMIVGLAVMGFGVGPLVFGPLLQALMGSDPARLGETIPRTFLILSVIFFVGVIGAAQLLTPLDRPMALSGSPARQKRRGWLSTGSV